MSKYSNPFPQHFDKNGNPLAFYTVYFGEPNQDTKDNPKAPFSDSALTTPIPTFQVLDNQGDYGADIFLDGAYSIRIETPLGALWRESASVEGISSLLALLTANDARYSATFGSVVSMVALTPIDGVTYVPVSGQSVYLTSYYTSIPFSEPQGGGGHFRVMTPAEYGIFPDETGAAFTVGDFVFVRAFGNTVSVKDFGVIGDGVTDDTPAFQLAQVGARAAKAHLLIPAGTDVKVISQLTVFDDEVWQLDGNIIRDWTTTDTDKLNKATIRNEFALAFSTYNINPGPFIPVNRNTGIKILGTGEIKNSAAVIAAIDPVTGPYAGPHLLFHASDDMHFGPITLRGPCAEWATMFWGDNVFYDGLKIRDQSLVFEDGIHIVGGTGHIGIVDSQSGDDALVLGSNFNQPISAVKMTVLAESISGNAVKLTLKRGGSSEFYLPVTSKIKDIHITAVGSAGKVRNGLVVITTDTLNDGYDTVEDVTLDINLTRGDGTHDLTNAFGLWMKGGKNIKIRGSISGSPKQGILATDVISADIDLSVGAPEKVNFDTVVITDGGNINIGGNIEAPTNRTGIEINSSDVNVKSKITGIQGSQAGVSVDTGSVLRFNGIVEGITSSRGITILDTASEIYIGNEADLSGVERPAQFTADPAAYRADYARGLSKTVTIAAGEVTFFGETELFLLGQGGVSDGISTLNNGQKGQALTLRNGEAVPGTAIITVVATGNIVLLSGDYALDTSEKAINLIFDGVNWQEISRY